MYSIWLFEQFFVDKKLFPDWENTICIYNKEEFISKISPNLLSFNSKSIYESWLLMLKNINTDIDELFRYCATDMDEYVVFLKDILIFLSYAIILDNEKDYIKHTNS